ncbi:hypothetical protein N800_11020 [Lysobacter daejeonensis GH1-9]|uniref:DUF3667 domain-containing protein n=1 Tax=Lysobacter daejeonensis GH1-9 TaxID=1385517 RepID=A0A0A0ERJ7_9GAMM|nr:DUF3667 domain-containing protein [Lysobacter daejeonensis]KGM53114.1 hypothetical protein N800_11020 [Lysobacter daejeonensis GH1-9]
MGTHSLTHCENCEAALQGPYCHACGQPVVSPVRHVAHAIEDVFESFWHLDGRVFRTLRDLLAPGRVALEYLAGHRVRYIAPLRLFVILSLLTFFVGKLAVHAEGPAFQLDPKDTQFAQLQTVAEVERVRDAALQRIAAAEDQAADTPGANPALLVARAQVQGAAAARIAELREQATAAGTKAEAKAAPATAPASAAPTPADAAAATDAVRQDAKAAPVEPTTAPATSGAVEVKFDQQWDPEKDPIQIGWLPDFANRWLTERLARAQRNITSKGNDGDALLQAFMGALPTALFMLVPVFALLLKVFYLRSRRLYLEHLTVALYSHAYMLLALLSSFLLVAVGNAFDARGSLVEPLTRLGIIAVWTWVPIYLLLMQKRVYVQGWWATVIKYLLIGWIYLVLVSFAALYALLAGLVGM